MSSTPAIDEFTGYAAVVRCTALFRRAVDRSLAEHGDLTRVQFEILSHLSDEPEGLRMFELADRMVHSRNGLTYQIKQLEKLGLVERGASSASERAVIAKITDSGREARQSLHARHLQLIRTQFNEVLSPDELAAISTGLSRVIEGLSDTLSLEE